MKIIQPSDEIFREAIRKQNYAGDNNSRLHNYCIDIPVDKGHLIYNSLTCELVFLDDAEYTSLLTNKYLMESWFVVPHDFDEKRFKKQSYKIHKLLSYTPKPLSNFTIFTTTDCNARCFYCFQKGQPHAFMSSQTADKISDFIIRIYNDSLKAKGKKVHLQWFGGEPLYNNKIITQITTNLKKAGVDYHSSMITNGYLFDQELSHIAHTLWKLDKVQITLDGTEEIYNRVKNYIYKDDNAYQRVLNNIDTLLNNKIQVVVRLNLDSYNADNLHNLAHELGQRFGKSKQFFCYGRALFEQKDKSFTQRDENQRTYVFSKLKQLEDILSAYNILPIPYLRKHPRHVLCKADAGGSTTILPDGRMGLCDYYIDSEFVSHIDNPDVRDKDVIRSFKEHCDDLPICDDCPVYPQCIRLKKCGEENYCFPQYKEYRIDGIRNAMLKKYEHWKKNKQTVNDENDDDEIIVNC